MLLRWFESAEGKESDSHPLEFTIFCTSGLFRKLLPHAGREKRVKDSSQNFLNKEFVFLSIGCHFWGLGLKWVRV